jgi:hypothetical protein
VYACQTSSVLNCGQFGENGSGKYSITSCPPRPTHLTNSTHSTLLQSIAELDIEIPPHIDVYLACGEAEPYNVNGVDLITTAARENAAKLESASGISASQMML